MVSVRLTISKDDPCLFITAVAKNRLPVFQTDAIKIVSCKAIDEARTSCGFLLFAYVIMPDHLHLLTDRPREPSKVLQFIKGIVSRRVLGYLKEKKYEASLRKLEHDDWKRNHRYSLWQHDSDVFSIVSESAFMQRSITSIRIPSAPAWQSARRTIVGRARGFGKAAQMKMSP